MSKELLRDEFAALPLGDQIKTLDRELKDGDPRRLLELSASLRDHAPLAYLSAKLLANEWLGDAENREWFAQFLVKEEETAVDKVMKALTEKAREALLAKKRSADALHEHLCGTLVEALQVVPISRLSSLCLLDRALKHNFLEARTQHVADTRKLCVDALKCGDLEPVTVDRLAHVRAEAIPELREAAKGAGILEQFDERRKELAHRTIDVIGNAPKAVSQANAEELLAKRVYTDPGHFLIELLQNAEDSGAKAWKLIFDADRIVIWHNGTDFDARDVVGVCSIGQTTKRKDQIGFFGVGFKSVYEVTNRPQIFSDLYQFEIADVSIPKVLRQRPKDLPEGGTLLILPLVNADDPVRSPAAMFKKAKAIDPYVLMTLKSMDELDFTLTKAAGGPVEHVLREIHFDDRRQRAIEKKGGTKQHYLLEHDKLNWEGPPRPAGRTEKTELMVGLTTDENRQPEWAGNGTSTVFSHLPTAEATGLRFFIQAHFEVPVDRERVNHDSDWNNWIMDHVPEQLARLADAVLEGPDPMAGARSFLKVLPLAGELVAPIYTRIADSLGKVMRNRDLIPCTDGKLHMPATALIADETLCALFEGTSIDGSLMDGISQPFAFVDPTLDERCMDVCRSLGCKPFEGTDLVKLLERAVKATPDKAPLFLAEPNAARFDRLAHCLLDAVEKNNKLLKRLQPLAIVPDGDGKLHSTTDPKKAPARGKDSLRKIYDGFRPFAAQKLDSLSAGPKPAGHVTELLDRLGAPKLTQTELLDDLESVLNPQGSQMKSIDATVFPGTRERLNLILIELANAPLDLQLRARELPIFPATDGTLCRGARNRQDRHGIVHARNVRHADKIRAFYEGVRPLLEVAVETGAAGRLLAATNVPALDLDLLANDLEGKLFELDSERIAQLHQLLETVCDSVDSNTRDIFCLLPIWPDQNGKPWPLVGDERVCLPSSNAIRKLLPDVPMLDETIAAMAHVKDLIIDPVGIDRIIHALAPDAKPPFAIPHERDRILEVQEYLLTSDEKLSSDDREALAGLPVFLDDTQTPRSLPDLVQTDDDRLRQLYAGTKISAFLDVQSSSMKLVEHLGLDARVTECTPETLIDDIARGVKTDGFSELTNELAKSNKVLHYLSDQSGQIPAHAIEMLMELPLFPDEKGQLEVMKSSQSSAEKKGMYAVQPELRRMVSAIGYQLLDSKIQEALMPLLRRANISVVKLRRTVELLAVKSMKKAPVIDVEILTQLHDFLFEERKELEKHFPAQVRTGLADGNPRLCGLKIWTTVTGEVISADEAVDPGPLLELLEEGSSEFEELQKRVLTPEATGQLGKLSPMLELCPAWRMAGEFITRFAEPGKPLSQQAGFISTPENLRQVSDLITQRKDITLADLEKLPVCDAAGCLQFGLLATADEETHALVSKLPVFEKLVHPHFNDFTVKGQGELFKPVEMEEILNAVLVNTETFRENGDQRLRFYNWLVSHEHKVMSQKACRKLIETHPCFMNAGGKLVVPGDLVVDPDLPDLGIDWAPHPDIPKEVLSLLTRQLKIGKPAIEKLIKSHIRTAYDEATRTRQPDRARELLVYLAKQLRGHTPKEVQELLPDLLLEDETGGFRPATELLQPTVSVEGYVKKIWAGAHPCPNKSYPPECRDFLIMLGVNTLPSIAQLRAIFDLGVKGTEMSIGLIGLISKMDTKTLSELPLREQPWIADGTGKTRRPSELFGWSPEVQALVGREKSLYADSQIRTFIGLKLQEALGFKSAKDVTLEDVIGRIRNAAKSGEIVPTIVYKWLERGLDEGLLEAGELRKAMERRPWVYTESGKFFNHKKVLGARAMEFFGARRGYWHEGIQNCPQLCALFEIPDEVTDAMVAEFMEELGREVAKTGDEELIKQDRAIPRMLLTCAARLGRSGARVKPGARVMVAKQAGSGKAGATRLLAASDKLLFRSETPTLEAQFAAIGKPFFLVDTGRSVADRKHIVAFYDAMGIRRLRDSYTAEVDAKSGEDTTRQSSSELAGLTSVLRALARVMPRVEKHRDQLSTEGWVYQDRLKSLGAAGEIRVIRDLSVRMTLKGVGSMSAPETARYDPKEAVLLVEDAALDDLLAHTPGLAEGLIPCIFEGNGEDNLVEIVELLLPHSSFAAMNRYLDRRHFPAVEMEESAEDDLLTRLGEVLDFGMHRRLQRRFPVLANKDFTLWRKREVLAQITALVAANPGAAATQAARILLEALDVKNPETPLLEAMVTIFTAKSLSDIPAALFVEKTEPQPDVELSDIKPEPEESAAEPAHWDPEPEVPPMLPPAPEPASGLDFGLFDKVVSFFRDDEEEDTAAAASAAPPGWSTGNNLSPTDKIRSQLDFSGDMLDKVYSSNAPAGFFYDPAPLSRPYYYGVQTYGATFDPASQEWREKGLPDLSHLEHLPPSAHVVRFKGKLAPGRSQLPIPMFAQLCGEPCAMDGNGNRVGGVQRRGDGGYEITITGGATVEVEFEVQLLSMPDLDIGERVRLSPALSRPTMDFDELPERIQQWLQTQRRNTSLTDSEQALIVAEFVQINYCYDKNFNETAAARRCRGRLRKGHGNHHLQLLHANADNRYLGRGVCMELNSMIVELIRHLGLPAVVATGWCFKEKNVTDPDHLFAVAIIRSPAGVCPLPLEAATGDGGRNMEMPVSGQTSDQDIERVAPPVPETAGAWSAPVIENQPETSSSQLVEKIRKEGSQELRERAAVLSQAIRLACKKKKKRLPANLGKLGRNSTPELVSEMRSHLEDILKDAELAAVLLALLRGEFNNVRHLPESVRKLEDMGLATIETVAVPFYSAMPGGQTKRKRRR